MANTLYINMTSNFTDGHEYVQYDNCYAPWISGEIYFTGTIRVTNNSSSAGSTFNGYINGIRFWSYSMIPGAATRTVSIGGSYSLDTYKGLNQPVVVTFSKASGSGSISMVNLTGEIHRTGQISTIDAGTVISTSQILPAYRFVKRSTSATYPYSAGTALRHPTDTIWTAPNKNYTVNPAGSGVTITATAINNLFLSIQSSDGWDT